MYYKKGDGISYCLHARQPVNANSSTCGITPELNELLDGEDASQVLDRSTILSMAAFELVVSIGVAGDPADMCNTDDVAVQVGFENTCAASWASTRTEIPGDAIAPGLNLCGLL
jgi:hypothetical protein